MLCANLIHHNVQKHRFNEELIRPDSYLPLAASLAESPRCCGAEQGLTCGVVVKSVIPVSASRYHWHGVPHCPPDPADSDVYLPKSLGVIASTNKLVFLAASRRSRPAADRRSRGRDAARRMLRPGSDCHDRRHDGYVHSAPCKRQGRWPTGPHVPRLDLHIRHRLGAAQVHTPLEFSCS